MPDTAWYCGNQQMLNWNTPLFILPVGKTQLVLEAFLHVFIGQEPVLCRINMIGEPWLPDSMSTILNGYCV